jgi:amino acid adenylation domain-containing protein
MENQSTAGYWLSPQQKHAWALAEAGIPAVAVALIAIEGDLKAEKLAEALRAVVSRHDILRTVFRRPTGMKIPLQVILDSAEPTIEAADLCRTDEASRERQLLELFAQHSTRAFDLEHGPVLRGTLVCTGQNRSTLVLSLPGLCGDAITLHRIVAELVARYAGSFSQTEEPLRYIQFAQWQNELLESDDENCKAARTFWKKQPLEELPPLIIPSELASGASVSRQSFAISLAPGEVERIVKTAGASSATDVLLAVWQCLISRLSGQTRFSIAATFDGRDYEELQEAVGPFAKNLPILARLDGDLRFSEIVQQVRDSVRECGENQDQFVPSATGSGVGFDYCELPSPQAAGGLTWRVVGQRVVSDGFKLRLSCVRSEDGLTLGFHYDASRLPRTAVERMAGSFQTLLAAAVAAPETPLSRLPLLNQAERKQILVEWNQNAADYPDSSFQELFEAQAARTSERPALRFSDRVLSYRELNEQANRLAHYLRRQGVGPDSLVGLCVERSAEMMIALLAILKAGGAYVPLNPDNPKPRLAQQLAGAVALVTEQKLAPQMPEFSGTTLCLDRDQKLWAKEAASNPQLTTTPDNLVYVIYTSGSTGMPKGVAVRHRNLVNYTHFITRRLELEKYPEGLDFATVSTIGADLGNTCIYPALASGGCLHVISYEVSTDPQRFAEYSSQHAIDVLKIVPSHLAALLHSAEAKALLPRKFLITGGETLTTKLLQRVEELGAGCEVLNHYGPTETTVGSLTLKLNQYDWKNSASIPIGRPIANTQVYILDAEQQPVPVGVIGELYIAGAGVTAGYLNQPERTAERFLPNPFVTDPKAMMYRTGDLARFDEQGRVEFLGRGDDQVKIRGFRIELGEIESVLTRQAAVKQAVVLAKEDPHGDKRLVAYIVVHRDRSVSAEELKSCLQQHLPDYMVPSAILFLPKIPLTANGKIDRQALPAPEQVQAKIHVGPRNPTEETIAAIWTEVLRRDRISIDDNFFDLGGHSLMATQVISRLREHFRIELGIRALFEKPTVAGLAEAIECASSSAEGSDSPIRPVSREAYRASST